MTPKAAHAPAAGRRRHPALAGWDQHLILTGQEGFQPSRAAATLQRPGLVDATDLDGGFTAWTAAGLPVTGASDQPNSIVVVR
jgi:3-mercaptopyruvate sulfurtransferase SseA